MSEDARLAARLAADAGRLLLDLRAAQGTADPAELRRLGDSKSNTLLLDALAAERPGDGVLSEESADSPARLAAERVWIIDPLDGTREFALPDRTDWAVHVALWKRGQGIVDAAVSQPALGRVHASDDPVPPTPTAGTPLRILVSDSRPPEFADRLATTIDAEIRPMGSAGAKAMAVLRGEADAYVHAGGQWEWDSAAPAGVLLAAGFHASRLDGSPLLYNQSHPYLPDLVMCRQELADLLLSAIEQIAHPPGE